MLFKILIQNFSLIDNQEIEFHKGLLVITGESGAGKSIIVSALRLMMGGRADLKSIENKEKKSVVEGTFLLDEKKFKNFFEQYNLDFEKETIIRREITLTGKSRAFINDTPVTLNTLQEVSERLIEIHSQFESSKLFSEPYQFSIIDSLVKNQNLLTQYQSEFKVFTQAKSDIFQLEKQLEKANKEADYNQYLLQELEEAQLDELNLDILKAKLSAQENAENIIEYLSQACQILHQDEVGILTMLNNAKIKLLRIATYSENFNKLSERIQDVYFELKDIFDSCENELEKVHINSEDIEELSIKLNFINTLLLKHQVQSIEELIDIRKYLSSKRRLVEDLEKQIKERSQLIENQKEKLENLAIQLTEKRCSGANIFVEKSQYILQRLGLESAKIEVELEENNDFNEYGKNRINFLFQANPGFSLKPIHIAISGGERSRLMLAVKKITAENLEVPTLILDEIDTGVSGRVAEEIGKLMQEIGQDMQIIVITHLAQVAAKGNYNYKVKKSEISGRSQSIIVPLNKDDKLHEIAQLLSGNKITNAAIEQAKELML